MKPIITFSFLLPFVAFRLADAFSAEPVTKTGPPAGGGPPPGVVGGGGGGPPRVPPTGGKGGGPPPGNPLLEKAFDLAFKLFYLGDNSGIQDSSKNLRVLWTRVG